MARLAPKSSFLPSFSEINASTHASEDVASIFSSNRFGEMTDSLTPSPFLASQEGGRTQGGHFDPAQHTQVMQNHFLDAQETYGMSNIDPEVSNESVFSLSCLIVT
jgi:hypothetical protein